MILPSALRSTILSHNSFVGLLIMAGNVSNHRIVVLVLKIFSSVHAKVDTPEEEASRELPSSAINAAIQEFVDRGGNLSDSSEEDE